MNLNWIMLPVTIYAVMALGWVFCVCLVISAHIDFAHREKIRTDEQEALKAAVQSLSASLEAAVAGLRDRPSVTVVPPDLSPVSTYKRAEALRMYRRGSDRHTIAGALRLPEAEAALLEKVHALLAEETNA
jgi:hypothetical protein